MHESFRHRPVVNAGDFRIGAGTGPSKLIAIARPIISGTKGDDILSGGIANETINGYEGNDLLFGNNGDDWIAGGDGSDELRGELGRDTLIGGNGADTLIGGGDTDRLAGGEGIDTLRGNSGDDILNGGAARDNMSGGTGADVFDFEDGDFGGLGVNSADRIYDFSQAEGDLIDLSGVDAVSATSLLDTFTFVGTDLFSGNAGELRYRFYGTSTLVQGDTDGDGDADFLIVVTGNHALDAGDFGLVAGDAMGGATLGAGKIEAILAADFMF